MQQQPKLRVSSGTAKNKKLKIPQIANFRATQEVVKQSIFVIIADKIHKSYCLDLYAGSGNLGIEALSRGAYWCDFVDVHKEAADIINENLFNTNFSDQSEVFRAEAQKYAANTDKTYDIIFIDPFYNDTAHVFLMKQVEQILKPEGMVFILYGKELKVDTIIKDTNLKEITTRRFGATHFSLLQVA